MRVEGSCYTSLLGCIRITLHIYIYIYTYIYTHMHIYIKRVQKDSTRLETLRAPKTPNRRVNIALSASIRLGGEVVRSTDDLGLVQGLSVKEPLNPKPL